MNHFDAVDFSDCHSEEVISFFWRSVYLDTDKLKYSSLKKKQQQRFACVE